jgi:hypothetical protein
MASKNPPNPYAHTFASVSLKRGPANYHLCYFCGLSLDSPREC